MNKIVLLLLAAGAAWYFWSNQNHVEGAYLDDGRPRTILFATEACGDACDFMRNYLKRRRVEFEEFDAFDNGAGQALYKNYGGEGYLPYTVLGSQRVTGPDAGSFISAVALELGPESVKEREAKALARHFNSSGEPLLVMYATDWCGYCDKARDYFVENGIAFVEFDIEKDGKAERAYEILKGTGTPLLYNGYQRVSGWNERRIKSEFGL
jgi:glutaredoxin